MRLKKNKTANKSARLDWDYQPPKINGGKETIDDMSLVVLNLVLLILIKPCCLLFQTWLPVRRFEAY